MMEAFNGTGWEMLIELVKWFWVEWNRVGFGIGADGMGRGLGCDAGVVRMGWAFVMRCGGRGWEWAYNGARRSSMFGMGRWCGVSMAFNWIIRDRTRSGMG